MSGQENGNAVDHQHLFSIHRKTRRPHSKFQLFLRRAISALVLGAIMTALVVHSLMNRLPDMWAAVVRFWLPRLDINAEPLLGAHTIYADWIIRQFAIYMPVTEPTSTELLAHALATFVLFAISLLIARKLLPLAHLLRILCAVHAVGLLVLAIRGNVPSVAAHTQGLYNFNLALMVLTPGLLAVGFYLYEGSLARRVLGSLLLLAYLAIALPFKLLAHAWLIKLLTPLAMPTLYLLFGPAFDVLLLVSLYAYVVSWGRHSLRWPSRTQTVTATP